jgi:ABC-type nitrate/sulfonate/bicarbonate transport system substrate-binding protein
MRKIYFLVLCAALVLLAARADALEQFILGYSGVGSGEEVHHLARKYGIFKKHGLDIEAVYIPGGSTVVQAMVSGEVQFGRGSPNEVVSAHLAGFPLKIITALMNKFAYSFVTPMSVAKPQDLKGKNIAVSRYGSGSDFITRMALKSWGLDPGKDVNILQIGNSPDRLAAMTGGKVHGSILSLSQTPRAKKLGLRVLADLSQLDTEYLQAVLYVTSTFIEKRPDVIRSFLKAYLEAIQMFKTNRPAAYDIIERNTGLKDRGEIEEYHAVLTKNFLLSYPVPTVAGMKTVLDDLGARNPKIRELKPENLIETRFLRELKDSGFVK